MKNEEKKEADYSEAFHVTGFCRNHLATGFREDLPSVRLCGLKERKVTNAALPGAKSSIKTLEIPDEHHFIPEGTH